MRKLLPMLVLILLLTGCRQTGQVENQAFAVVMSLDTVPGGGISVGILLPKMNSQSEEYLTATAEGRSFSDAAEGLRELFPRAVNLSHIKMIVASEELAKTDAFASILRDMAANYPLALGARFVVSRGSATEFIALQDTTVGSRLSTGIIAMFEHYTSTGTVPDVTLSDLVGLMDSCYSSPIAVYGRHGDAEVMSGDAKKEIDFQNSNLYSGTAVFRDGKLCLILDSDETALLSLLRGRKASLIYDEDGVFSKIRLLQNDIFISEDAISVSLRLNATLYDCSAEELESCLESGVRNLIAKCQQAGCEPFQFAECAARQYPDLAAWREQDWLNRFSETNMEIKIQIQPQSA